MAPLTRISSDPLTRTAPFTGVQHASEVEPDVYSAMGISVATFQVGRLYNGGSMALGWAVDRNGDWRHGILPGITKSQTPARPYDRISDSTVAYDARHRVWLIAAIAVTDDKRGRVAHGTVVVSRSSDGVHWGAPSTVAYTLRGFYDKDWITCDDTPTSPYYGHCYAQWDRAGRRDVLLMSTSTDGGRTWRPPLAPRGYPNGIGGQPVVRPDGTVVVPALGEHGSIIAYASHDGGASWGAAVAIAKLRAHQVAGHLRTEPLPSAGIDGAGTVYVAWQDCRFEPHCAANDVVLSRSTDGTTWSPVTRVPIDPVGSGADHFIPGLGVNRATRGAHAQLALAYYYYPTARCMVATCRLYAGFISSRDGGRTWSAPRRLAGPMRLAWLAKTSQGSMVGDYIATTFDHAGDAVPVIAVAGPPHAPGNRIDEAMYAARISLNNPVH